MNSISETAPKTHTTATNRISTQNKFHQTVILEAEKCLTNNRINWKICDKGENAEKQHPVNQGKYANSFRNERGSKKEIKKKVKV
jgi:hypothetical protein